MKSILAFILLIALAAFIPVDNVHTRFKPSAGYTRVAVAPGSFGAYLQGLTLKPAGTHTKTYTGSIARTDPYTAAVVDMSIGVQDLQQCADAVMRLRAEYLYKKKNYNAITFNFTSGFKCDYTHYADGYRYINDRWALKGKKNYSYQNFLRYMNLVFSYAGTLSLQKELKPVANPNDIKAGDVFIKGGSPGHCFIVMDIAENAAHKKQFLLAQSFMPAQNIQVLQNGSPWFSLGTAVATIPYGELVDAKYLRRF
ncbi:MULTISPECIES: DUF4846 domain-containing protein [unclassified Mucilaginibacter]|uniref:DUF4846 domain-containing protein n=1 Tax=unclassified Mucilaginibacter TaxID=2617802 RepID=UPI002AC91CFE|nr:MULTISPECIES: DUF4846 domain-containing protein [unclassified Mucilaginibacter]MEB0263401.1 DUF4846 domain-containing protein [Mucilaginibacter sp. 10I4]MEB0278570.1 DUF4846 domain-containing protein [Mucilaginibacter sp. 10B2]MEB0299281.1 DUF4846 domain-containing protein [Mucilaginibacter sp. 5C4]WPX23474.1 DUF4846 domain-containing protein [Mucilaginibacter sp. 5C4]